MGHEIDHTICDFVADAVASTPTAAAVMAVPDQFELHAKYNAIHKNINAIVKQIYDANTKKLNDTRRMMEALSPQKSFDRYDGSLMLLEHRMQNAVDKKLLNGENTVKATAARLNALNPLTVLAHGYSVAEIDGKLVKSKTQINKGDKLTLTFSDGKTTAVATGE